MTTELQRGNRLCSQKRYSEALEAFLAHARNVPSEAPRAFVQAAETLRRANTLAAPVAIAPGVTLVSQGDACNAEAMYRRALSMDPDFWPALRGLATLLDGPAQRQALEAAVAARPDPLLVQLLGELYEREGQRAEAEQLYARALHARPNDRDLKAAHARVAFRVP